jgi:C-terminal processing protease CtpA/Prc
MRPILSSIGLTVALLCPWTAAAQPPPPSSCSTSSQNLWVRDQLNTYYYWYQQLPTGVNPALFTSPEAYLEAVRYRPIDNTYSYITSAAANEAFYSDSQVIKYGFTQQVTTTDIRVYEVWTGSAAEEAGLARGDRITHVNGRTVADLVASNTLGAAFGPDVEGQQATIRFEKPSGETREATMTKRITTIPTVSLTRVVEQDGRRIGYVYFRNFVRPSVAALNDAFAALKQAGATELVLDLRYNGGGLVDVAVHLASLIGGVRTSGQVLFSYIHNDRIGPAWNRSTRFNDAPEQTLNLERLVVITTRSSASASELIINSLRPYMPVAVIGDTTYGKPVGQYGFTFCEKILVPVAFSLRNANNEGDFFDGIPPTCAAADDTTHQLGDTEEGSFAEALTYIRTGGCSVQAEGAARALRSVRPVLPRETGWAALINAQ